MTSNQTSGSQTTATVPGYREGTWDIDPVHSEIGFSVRHLMVSKVRGKFTKYSGSFVTAADPAASSVEVSIDLASVDTGNEQRDEHLRSADFFQVVDNPTMTFRSTGVRQGRGEDRWVLDGQLSVAGVTQPVTLDLEVNGFGPDPFGGYRSGFTATGEVSRKDFGVSWNAPLETGGVVVGDKVQISIEIEGVLRSEG